MVAKRRKWFRCYLSSTPGFSDPSDRDCFLACSPKEALDRAKKRWWDQPGLYVVAKELDVGGKETGICRQGRIPKNGHVEDAPKKLLMLGEHVAEQDGMWVSTVWPLVSKVVRESEGTYTGELIDSSGNVLDGVVSTTAENVAEILNETAGDHIRRMMRIGSHVPLSQQVSQKREEGNDEVEDD